jgi:HSP20 family protein
MIPTRNRGTAFGPLVDMSRDMERLMNSVWAEGAQGAQWGMPAEVVETDDEVRFDVELAGCREEDIDVTLENNVLTIAAEKKVEREEGRSESDYRLFERRYGRFQRSFTVPPTVRGDACEARYDNGVLTVRLPKSEEAKPRRIQIAHGRKPRNLEQGGQQDGGESRNAG